MDFVVQKATELGVKRITPVFTEYGVVKLNAARAAKRNDHWQSVAIGACEQSGRIRPPLIDAPVDLNAWFGDRHQGSRFGSYPATGRGNAIVSIAAPVTKVCLLIGPKVVLATQNMRMQRLQGSRPYHSDRGYYVPKPPL